MTEEEYSLKLREAEIRFNKTKDDIYIEFATSNKKFSIGDVLRENSDKTIIVDKITTYKSFGLPEAVYHGIELKKDLSPKKGNIRSSIYGHHNVVKINQK